MISIPSEPVLEAKPTGPWKYLVEIKGNYVTLKSPSPGLPGRTFSPQGKTSFAVRIGLTPDELTALTQGVGTLPRPLTLHRSSRTGLTFRMGKPHGQQDSSKGIGL